MCGGIAFRSQCRYLLFKDMSLHQNRKQLNILWYSRLLLQGRICSIFSCSIVFVDCACSIMIVLLCSFYCARSVVFILLCLFYCARSNVLRTNTCELLLRGDELLTFYNQRTENIGRFHGVLWTAQFWRCLTQCKKVFENATRCSLVNSSVGVQANNFFETMRVSYSLFIVDEYSIYCVSLHRYWGNKIF